MKRPKTIRKVVKFGRDQRVKMVRDFREKAVVTRIQAHTLHACGYTACPANRLIEPGDEYANVAYTQQRQYSGFRNWPVERTYHFDCLPPELKPVIRFFYPTGGNK